jgi:hypothetical protein
VCHPITIPSIPHLQAAPSCAALALGPAERQDIAVAGLAGSQSITGLADEHDVSRKFVHGQVAIARAALEAAFTAPEMPDDKVLFYLPVTKSWLKQCVLSLVFSCRSSVRAVTEYFSDLLDYPIAVGTVHNIVHGVVPRAIACNTAQDLSAIRIGAHDEIFQKRQPVLVGMDTASTYCYLLSLEEHRDAETWGLRLLELMDRRFAPEAIIADFGSGLRAGQKLALPGTPCWGDVFHGQQELHDVVAALDNRAYQALTACDDLENKQAKHEWKRGSPCPSLGQKLRHARPAVALAVTLADDVRLLARWLREDVWAVAGPELATRLDLYDFIVAELQTRKALCPSRLGPICTLLVNQRDNLLAFAGKLDQELATLAQEFAVPAERVRDVLRIEALPEENPRRWPEQSALQRLLGHCYYPLSLAVHEVLARTVRASSAVENLNSRLRNYFFLRRELGPEYLSLLQFFLNHRRFLRSEHPERVGKSPAELLNGKPGLHWLEMLGFRMFRRQ